MESRTSKISNDKSYERSYEKYVERQKLEEKLEKNATILIMQKKFQKVDSFTGYFEFLHNNFLSPIYYEGSLYPSVTHAYHAARSRDEQTKNAILNADSFQTVAKIARRIEDPEGWSLTRTSIMERLVRDKFRRSRELQEKLKATEKRELLMTYDEETPGNFFWGTVKEKGQNQLGRILMKIRNDLLSCHEVFNWITTNFDLINDLNFLPDISIFVNKQGAQIDHIVLKSKPFYLFGLFKENDMQLDHPSISRTHAVIICDKNLGVVLIDLKSKAGTKLDNDIIRDHIPYRLKDGKKINFALSTRDYIIKIDLEKVKKVYDREKLKLQSEVKTLKSIEESSLTTNQTDSNQNLRHDLIKKKIFQDDLNISDTVFINHIPTRATQENLIKLFEEEFGKVKNFFWPNDRTTGLKKAYAFIKFDSLDSAKDAVDYGLISYDFDEEENEENFDIGFKPNYKGNMIKIKFADKDKFIPEFVKDKSGLSKISRDRPDYNEDDLEKDSHRRDYERKRNTDYKNKDKHKIKEKEKYNHKNPKNPPDKKINHNKTTNYHKNENKDLGSSSSSSSSKKINKKQKEKEDKYKNPKQKNKLTKRSCSKSSESDSSSDYYSSQSSSNSKSSKKFKQQSKKSSSDSDSSSSQSESESQSNQGSKFSNRKRERSEN
jgi:ribA/ribD-fused uncharacterized protein